MTSRKQHEARTDLLNRLSALGFTAGESEALIRIERTLHRWSEEECNGTIQRDGERGDGPPRRWYETRTGEHVKGSIIADREAGALRRLAKIVAARNDWGRRTLGRRGRAKLPIVEAYIQGDPRGCALYIVPLDKLAGRTIDSCYSCGVGVCS